MDMEQTLDHNSFSKRNIIFKHPSKLPSEGHGAFVSEAWWSAFNRALLSLTNRFQMPSCLQRSDATMAANSAVWIVHVSYQNLLGSLARIGLDAAEELLKWLGS